MRLLEPLGPQQGVDEIDEEKRGHEAAEHIVESMAFSSKPVAAVGVGDRQGEEAEAERRAGSCPTWKFSVDE